MTAVFGRGQPFDFMVPFRPSNPFGPGGLTRLRRCGMLRLNPTVLPGARRHGSARRRTAAKSAPGPVVHVRASDPQPQIACGLEPLAICGPVGHALGARDSPSESGAGKDGKGRGGPGTGAPLKEMTLNR